MKMKLPISVLTAQQPLTSNIRAYRSTTIDFVHGRIQNQCKTQQCYHQDFLVICHDGVSRKRCAESFYHWCHFKSTYMACLNMPHCGSVLSCRIVALCFHAPLRLSTIHAITVLENLDDDSLHLDLSAAALLDRVGPPPPNSHFYLPL